MKNKSVVVATFKSHDDAAAAIKALQQCVFDLEQLSLVESKQTVQTELIGFYQTGQRVKVWGELGAIWGMIIGSGIFFDSRLWASFCGRAAREHDGRSTGRRLGGGWLECTGSGLL